MIRKVVLSTLLLIALAACNLNFISGGSTTEPQAGVGQSVSQTFDAQTQVAQSVQQTMAAMVTDTPSETPQPTFTYTPEVPRVSVSVETNCRSGPGTAYDILGVLPVGQSAEVIGRNAGGDTWIIRLPSNPAIICWLWGFHATVSGNTSGLTVYTPPPTPTPVATFTATYDGMITCMGEFAFRFNITNPGSVTWESVQVVVTDTVTATVNTHISDSFKDRSGCPIDNNLQNLESGEPGVVTTAVPGQFAYDPSGHAMTAAITLCPQDALAGACVTKTVSFTP